MSDIYPAEDLLWLANNMRVAIFVRLCFRCPVAPRIVKTISISIEQLMKKVLTISPACVSCCLATGATMVGMWPPRVGELKAMLALAGGDLEQALIWTEWTMEFTCRVQSRTQTYYRRSQTLLLLSQRRCASAAAISHAFIKMYGASM